MCGPLDNLFVKFGFSLNTVKDILEKCSKKSSTKFQSRKCEPNSPRFLQCLLLDTWIHTR